ncbi:MAG: NAD(P)H-binding protein [Lactobacillaceae bacterium]|jgi:putative NADH-flavin reductase|nr:NAD(P)H-binding protein [Lactobacillaceae bacterium]
MKIGVIGATGNAGSAMIIEGYQRGHEMTAIVRNPQKAAQMFGPEIKAVGKDVFDLSVADLAGFDAVIDAYAPRDHVENHVKFAEHLTSLLQGSKTLGLFIIGSSSLKMADGTTMNDRLVGQEAMAPWVPVALAQGREFDYLQTVKDANWIAFSPQQGFIPGAAMANGYTVGTDEIMSDGNGQSMLMMGAAAKAIMDELETPTHIQSRFTAVNN